MKYKTRKNLTRAIARLIIAGITLLAVLGIFASMTACAKECGV
jgi:hypothetical protein